jgi:hypothetical protein
MRMLVEVEWEIPVENPVLPLISIWESYRPLTLSIVMDSGVRLWSTPELE